jgi:hypothetical protein
MRSIIGAMHPSIAGSCAIACILLAAPAAAIEPDAASVVFSSGQSGLSAIEGKSSRLRKGQQVAVGNLIRTGPSGHVQIRFPDGTFVSVHASSDLRIDAFRYHASPEQGAVAQFTLFRGNARFMPGAIGKVKGSRFRLVTAVAAVDLHASEISAEMGNELRLTVGTGRVDVRNDGGTLSATQGHRVLVRDRRTPPAVVGTLLPYPILPEAR